MDLVRQFTQVISHSWSAVFKSDVFTVFEDATVKVVTQLLDEFEISAAENLKDAIQRQRKACLRDVRFTLQNTSALVRQILEGERKEISRSMVPHVQGVLAHGYREAADKSGPGSFARQKVCGFAPNTM